MSESFAGPTVNLDAAQEGMASHLKSKAKAAGTSEKIEYFHMCKRTILYFSWR